MVQSELHNLFNSSPISLQISRMATPFQKIRLPKNNYLYKIERVFRMRSDKVGGCPHPPYKETQPTGHDELQYKCENDKHGHDNNMIENFCKAFSQQNPPHEYIKQLANHAHACIKTYYKLWEVCDDKKIIYIGQLEIPNKLNIQPQKFQRDLIDIAEEKLCNWSKVKIKKKKYFKIE